ncbi:MAG: hypothetical protein M5R36_07455 [Deltaproteobacteria bacterium]|nr:hypothetical protein [Deltaproteobacteria bacterium]
MHYETSEHGRLLTEEFVQLVKARWVEDISKQKKVEASLCGYRFVLDEQALAPMRDFLETIGFENGPDGSGPMGSEPEQDCCTIYD